MKDDTTAWFHCGRCASLFKSAIRETGQRRCTECGEDPSLGLESPVVSGSAKADAREPLLRVKRADVETGTVRKREVRRRKTGNFAVKLVVVWMLALVALGAGVRWLTRDKPREEATYTLADSASRGTLADADVAQLTKAYPKCRELMAGFLAAGTPEERNQFVRTPVDTAGRMARFYQMNAMSNIDLTRVRGGGGGVIPLKNHRAIETRWQTTDGLEFDGVFFDEDGEWRLDWEDFVRYGDHPWALFLSGDGPEVGEFRLFARERLAEQRSEVSKLKIVLHAPKFGSPAEYGEASPEFRIDQDSPQGHLLKEALAVRATGKRIFGSSLSNHDPEGMIRVRVKVRRSEGTLGREFTIEEVKACHWLSIPEPGVEP